MASVVTTGRSVAGSSVDGGKITMRISAECSCKVFTVTSNSSVLASDIGQVLFVFVTVCASFATAGQIWWVNSTCVVAGGVLLASSLSRVQSESLLIIPNVGILYSAHRALSALKSSTFVSFSDLRHAVINEGVAMHRTIFYLALVIQPSDTETRPELLPLFVHTAPELQLLEDIFVCMSKCMQASVQASPLPSTVT